MEYKEHKLALTALACSSNSPSSMGVIGRVGPPLLRDFDVVSLEEGRERKTLEYAQFESSNLIGQFLHNLIEH